MATPEIVEPSDLWKKVQATRFVLLTAAAADGSLIVDDEDLVLIEIKASQAECWNVRESEMVQFFKMAKAAFTGTPPTDLGEHGTMDVGGQSRPNETH